MEKPNLIVELEKKINTKLIQLDEIKISYYITEGYQGSPGYLMFNNKVIGLSLRHCKLENIYFLVNFPEINRIQLGHNNIIDISPLTNCRNLEKLELINNKISNISTIQNLSKLKCLLLGQNKIKDISKLRSLKDINHLDLSGNCIQDISILSELKNIIRLDIGSNKISDISSIQSLRGIKELILRYNPIKILPEWITEFPEIADIEDDWIPPTNGYIMLSDNPIEQPPMEIVRRGKRAIKAWYAEEKKSTMVANPFVKLIVVGNTSIGKTSIIKFLIHKEFSKKENSTHGIAHYLWNMNKSLIVNVWDFGGQEYYHSTHRIFFSNKTLYLVVYDKAFNQSGYMHTNLYYPGEDDYVIEKLEHFDYSYWLDTIRSLSKSSNILLLQSKVDNPDDVIYPDNYYFDPEGEYKVQHPFMHVSTLNSYNYYKEMGHFDSSFKQLESSLFSKLSKIKHGQIFSYYLECKKLIETQSREQPIMQIKDFIRLCKTVNEKIDTHIIDHNHTDTGIPAWLLMVQYFNDIGFLLYYPEIKSLENTIFIDPTHITKEIYKVLNYSVKKKLGHFNFNDVYSLYKNKKMAADIISLMKAPNFNLIFEYPSNSDNYIAPQFLPNEQPNPKYVTHIIRNMDLAFALEFKKTIPRLLLAQFMIKYGRFQKDDIIWKYGIVFEKYNTTVYLKASRKENRIIFRYNGQNSSSVNNIIIEGFKTLIELCPKKSDISISLDEKTFYAYTTILEDQTDSRFNNFRQRNKGNYSNVQHSAEISPIIANYITQNITTMNIENFNNYGVVVEKLGKLKFDNDLGLSKSEFISIKDMLLEVLNRLKQEDREFINKELIDFQESKEPQKKESIAKRIGKILENYMVGISSKITADIIFKFLIN